MLFIVVFSLFAVSSSAMACREWDYPTRFAWNVDYDCCAGIEQQGCASGYELFQTATLCYVDDCNSAYSYSCVATDDAYSTTYPEVEYVYCGESDVVDFEEAFRQIGLVVLSCCAAFVVVLGALIFRTVRYRRKCRLAVQQRVEMMQLQSTNRQHLAPSTNVVPSAPYIMTDQPVEFM